jgi:glycosyltransferase involved in cell wall biosynthesis
MRRRFYHIYPAGNGNNILYINSIKAALDDQFDQVVFTSAKSPVRGIRFKRWFHPVTDFWSSSKKAMNLLRYLIRYIEFLFALFAISVTCFFRRPAYVNLSTATFLKVEFYFVTVLKKLGIKVMYTCHDAIQFDTSHRRMTGVLLKKFYHLFDHIIVHNDFSKKVLMDEYSIGKNAFIQFPFPPMDLKQLKLKEEDKPVNKRYVRNFLFIGYFRKEKGYDLLIEAWKHLDHKKIAARVTYDYHLSLVGSIPQNVIFRHTSNAEKRITISNKLLTDLEYFDYIDNAEIVVLPYLVGTNSGVLSTVMSLGKVVLCSDIDSLRESCLTKASYFFKTGDIESLKQQLTDLIVCSQATIQNNHNTALHEFDRVYQEFVHETQRAFKGIGNT